MKKREQLLFNSNSELLNGATDLTPIMPDSSNLDDDHNKTDSIIVKAQSEPDLHLNDALQIKTKATGKNRIQLIVRIRPFLQNELVKECIKIIDETGIRLFREYHQIHFRFDNIIMPNCSQVLVFSQVQKIIDIVQNFMLGLNGTIFAQQFTFQSIIFCSGQTGAGKTYSIMGQQENSISSNEKRGILPRTLDYIFDIVNANMKQKDGTYKLQVSFLEIYNEKLNDLLISKNTKKQRGQLDIREEKDGYFSVPDLTRIDVTTIQEAYEQLEKGLNKRATSSTSLNSKSSRSHSIFQIYMQKWNKDNVLVFQSKLRIVDLAGSEKYNLKTEIPLVEKNMRIQELTSINSSLSALGQCISALADLNRKHIPYRNSKLTKILKDSLDEGSQVALIICISPSVDSYKETFSTLQFADRAKKAVLDCRNFSDPKLLVNVQDHSSMENLIKAYNEEKAIRQELQKFVAGKNQKDVVMELEKLKQQNQELKQKVQLLESNSNQMLGGQSNKKEYLKGILKQQTQDLDNIVKHDRKVKFAMQLDNDHSLDSDTRERIEHNLKYNDDTIFENISIFNNDDDAEPGENKHPVSHRKQEQHPNALKHKKEGLLLKENNLQAKQNQFESDEEDDEEDAGQNQIQQKQENQKQQIQYEKVNNDIELDDKFESPIKPKKSENEELKKQDRLGFSPIINQVNTSLSFSKDLISDLQTFQQPYGVTGSQFKAQSSSGADKTIGSNNHQQIKKQKYKQNDSVEEASQESSTIIAKDYHVCESSEQFLEPDFMNGQSNNYEEEVGMLSEEQKINLSVIKENKDLQNTLILDSQSIIMESGDANTNLLSNNMNNPYNEIASIDASGIMANTNEHSIINHQIRPQLSYQHVNNPMIPSATHSVGTDDALTYSLTNTYSTIESLHEELAAIRQGLDFSQQKNQVLLKTIHQYAKEIEHEEQKIPKHKLDSHTKHSIQQQRKKLFCIDDMQQFQKKLHNEFNQLKHALLSQHLYHSDEKPTQSENIDVEYTIQRNQVNFNVDDSKRSKLTIKQQSKYTSPDHSQIPQHSIYSKQQNQNIVQEPQSIDKIQDTLQEIKYELSKILQKQNMKHNQVDNSQKQLKLNRNQNNQQSSDKVLTLFEQLQSQLSNISHSLPSSSTQLLHKASSETIGPIKQINEKSSKLNINNQQQQSSGLQQAQEQPTISNMRHINHQTNTKGSMLMQFMNKNEYNNANEPNSIQNNLRSGIPNIRNTGQSVLVDDIEDEIGKSNKDHQYQNNQQENTGPKPPLTSAIAPEFLQYDELSVNVSNVSPSGIQYQVDDEDRLMANDMDNHKLERTPELFKSLNRLSESGGSFQESHQSSSANNSTIQNSKQKQAQLSGYDNQKEMNNQQWAQKQQLDMQATIKAQSNNTSRLRVDDSCTINNFNREEKISLPQIMKTKQSSLLQRQEEDTNNNILPPLSHLKSDPLYNKLKIDTPHEKLERRNTLTLIFDSEDEKTNNDDGKGTIIENKQLKDDNQGNEDPLLDDNDNKPQAVIVEQMNDEEWFETNQSKIDNKQSNSFQDNSSFMFLVNQQNNMFIDDDNRQNNNFEINNISGISPYLPNKKKDKQFKISAVKIDDNNDSGGAIIDHKKKQQFVLSDVPEKIDVSKSYDSFSSKQINVSNSSSSKHSVAKYWNQFFKETKSGYQSNQM